MLPYFWYLLKVIICSGILFGYYWLFLRNKIFHQYNRFYLLAAMSLSLLLPLLKINFWQPAAQQNQAIRVLQAVSAGDEYVNTIVIPTSSSSWSFEQVYPLIYWLISIIFLVAMLRTIYLILRLLKRYAVQQIEEISFVNTEDDSTPFSFFKYIFWNSGIDINTTTGRQIFKHEVAHIEEKHTHDKFFVNIVLIFCWCNPFFWLYRKELNMIHEFIADKKAVENSDTAAFAAMILQAAYPRHRFELTNNFFYSPVKRRLLMLTKKNNPKISYIARLMVLPLAVLVFAAFTFKAKSIKNNSPLIPVTNQLSEYPIVTENGLPDIAHENILPVINDTLPDNLALDPEKALIIMNGKIMGKGKMAAEGFNNLNAQSVSVKWLNRKEAIAKYGNDGADGACEVNYIEGTVFTTAYADVNRRSIFYIGMENPVKIKVQNVNPEDIIVNISEGSVSGNNGSYIVRVSQPGHVTLTLSKRDGTIIPATFTAEAKFLPNPSGPDFPSELRNKLTYDNSNSLVLDQKLMEEQAKLNMAEKEKVAQWQKLNDKQILNEKLAAINLDTQKERVVLGRKLNEIELQKEKEKLGVEEQLELKLNKIERDKVVAGRKLSELEMLNLKQKMLLDKQVTGGVIEVRQDELELLAREKNLLLAQQNNKVFTKVEIDPQFTGGEEAWRKYLRENLNLKAIINKGAIAGKYTVVLAFIVNTDGSLSDIKCENDPGFGACAEALRFIKTTPTWQPAIQNGKKVNAYVRKSITFFIAGVKGGDGTTSWNKIKTTSESNAYYVSAKPYMSFSSTPYVLASIKPAIDVKFTATYSSKVCSNINSVQ